VRCCVTVITGSFLDSVARELDHPALPGIGLLDTICCATKLPMEKPRMSTWLKPIATMTASSVRGRLVRCTAHWRHDCGSC
jgi:hypothetical protein